MLHLQSNNKHRITKPHEQTYCWLAIKQISSQLVPFFLFASTKTRSSPSSLFVRISCCLIVSSKFKKLLSTCYSQLHYNVVSSWLLTSISLVCWQVYYSSLYCHTTVVTTDQMNKQKQQPTTSVYNLDLKIFTKQRLRMTRLYSESVSVHSSCVV